MLQTVDTHNEIVSCNVAEAGHCCIQCCWSGTQLCFGNGHSKLHVACVQLDVFVGSLVLVVLTTFVLDKTSTSLYLFTFSHTYSGYSNDYLTNIYSKCGCS